MRVKHLTALIGLAVCATTGLSNADEILVGDCAQCTIPADIEQSMTWTSDNTYNLTEQITVRNGATLTIQPGTLVASTPSANGSGSLAIARGSKIEALGTRANPIIFTSTNDDFTNWREAANEWGNITIMGQAYISNSFVAGNTATCGNNISPMEGLVADFKSDPDVRYGGTNDDDCSGTLSYVSIRYGGRVVGLDNELNGLSLGGIGRETDIHHVEIMNNVDDGIEIWGGTVNLKHVSIWNVGDDSFDIDQGWRGRAQFGLIVQGYSVDASQGSGVGDNCIETDGAENSDAQPVTTAAIYNFTVIGQPFPGAGDGGTAWRDGARIQYRNCIFMDLGERLVRPDGDDGDGSQGYGFNGTLTWPQVWQTNYQHYTNDGDTHPNACNDPASIYTVQTDGRLAEMRSCLFFRNLWVDGDSGETAYTEASNRGVFAAAFNNMTIPGFDDADMPIAALVRDTSDADNDGNPGVTRGGKIMLPVISIDPRATNEAVSGAYFDINDGEQADPNLCVVEYRGAFGPDENWLCNWTAADAYGFIIAPPGGCPVNKIDCPQDLSGDNFVDTIDLLDLLGAWGACKGCPQDLNEDGIVDTLDLLDLLGAWGVCD